VWLSVVRAGMERSCFVRSDPQLSRTWWWRFVEVSQGGGALGEYVISDRLTVKIRVEA
jgi:hypothetical protein